ncbi:MAG: HAD family hydrolase [Nanoarchaeota archaeon]
MRYNAVIFDFFGTLTEGRCAPEDKIVAEWKLDERKNFDYHFIEDITCGTPCEMPFTEERKSNYFQTLISRFELPENSEKRLRQIFHEDILGERLISGAREIVADLKSKGYKLAMVSDLPNPDYDLSKTKFNFADLFDFRHLSYDPVWINSLKDGQKVLKPEITIFKKILSELGTNSENTLMVGNSLRSDIEPARKLGMRAVLVDYKGKYLDDLDRIESLNELKKIL